MDFLYEIPHDAVAPYCIPGLLRTVLTGPQIYSSSDVDEVMGMTLVRLRPEEISPAPEPEHGRALTVLRALYDPGDEENPFLIGFLMHGEGLLRLYVQRPDRPGVIGVDIRLAETPHRSDRLIAHSRERGAVPSASPGRPALRSPRGPDRLVGRRRVMWGGNLTGDLTDPQALRGRGHQV
ncbi:hypothetical protein ACSYGO_45620 [Streptomyces krungchingensis]